MPFTATHALRMESPAGLWSPVGMGRWRDSGDWRTGLPDEERNGREREEEMQALTLRIRNHKLEHLSLGGG